MIDSGSTGRTNPTSPLGYLTPATLIARRMLRALAVTLKLAALV
jgi:hypothetical protein